MGVPKKEKNGSCASVLPCTNAHREPTLYISFPSFQRRSSSIQAYPACFLCPGSPLQHALDKEVQRHAAEREQESEGEREEDEGRYEPRTVAAKGINGRLLTLASRAGL